MTGGTEQRRIPPGEKGAQGVDHSYTRAVTMPRLPPHPLLALATLVAVGCPTPKDDTAAPAAPGEPVIVAIVAVHNVLNGDEDPPVGEPLELYRITRDGLLDFAIVMDDAGIPWSFQSTPEWLEAAALFEPQIVGEGPTVVADLADLGVELDPLSYEAETSYADAACMIEGLGGTPSHVTGGFIAAPATSSQYDLFLSPQESTRCPGTTWAPHLLFGAATYQHEMEQDLWISGLWRPAGADAIDASDPGAPLPLYGTWRPGSDGLQELLVLHDEGRLEPGHLYTATVYLDQNLMDGPEYAETARLLFDQFNPWVTTGTLRWMTLEGAADLWRARYRERPTLLRYDGK